MSGFVSLLFGQRCPPALSGFLRSLGDAEKFDRLLMSPNCMLTDHIYGMISITEKGLISMLIVIVSYIFFPPTNWLRNVDEMVMAYRSNRVIRS